MYPSRTEIVTLVFTAAVSRFGAVLNCRASLDGRENRDDLDNRSNGIL